jgi:ferredoxin-NADP reductase
MSVETFEIEIRSIRQLAPNVKEFVFSRTDNRPLQYAPGQWLNLVLPMAGGEIRRAYSIASPPRGTASFELAVTEVVGGPGSGYLCGLETGARLRAIGPQGFFTREPLDPSPALLVATGTGVTPLRAMMLAALAAGDRRAPQASGPTSPTMWLLVGVRHERDMLYRDELEALARIHPHFRVMFTLSQAGPAWTGRRGYVQLHLRALWEELSAVSSSEPHVYICGLEKMVGAVRHLFRKELGVPRQRVHSERYD